MSPLPFCKIKGLSQTFTAPDFIAYDPILLGMGVVFNMLNR